MLELFARKLKMPYNVDLEDRIDHLAPRLGDLTKKKMFGGVGYMSRGNMCFGIHKESLLLRTSPEKGEELLKSEYFRPFDMTRNPMKGWVLVSPDAVETDEQLLEMLEIGLNYANSLPAK